eukprot:CAMPEP_0115849516 /NCGR_PEP_ID=MMETSP0287-20121206/11491_1 /TAXON_ID=412157 /ORGANISM="Chrysochromulina rotalis, Strain UIO044" /LENGTH=97 /DNA_ID=CAMNT_0003303489 /DNA_START=412 /DNA_END=702 /DNA_ORIENTATION=-
MLRLALATLTPRLLHPVHGKPAAGRQGARAARHAASAACCHHWRHLSPPATSFCVRSAPAAAASCPPAISTCRRRLPPAACRRFPPPAYESGRCRLS